MALGTIWNTAGGEALTPKLSLWRPRSRLRSEQDPGHRGRVRRAWRVRPLVVAMCDVRGARAFLRGLTTLADKVAEPSPSA